MNSLPPARPTETVVRCGERDRQDEAVVVVGVLAEQVDASGRARQGFGQAPEGAHEGVAHDRLTGTACSSRALSSGSASMAKKPAPSSVPARYLRRSRVR